MKCNGTRVETRFCLLAKRTSPFKSAGALVQSTICSRVVRISGRNGSNAGYTIFHRWYEGYWLPTPFGSFPFTYPPVRHRVPSRFNWTLYMNTHFSAACLPAHVYTAFPFCRVVTYRLPCYNILFPHIYCHSFHVWPFFGSVFAGAISRWRNTKWIFRKLIQFM